MTTVVKDMNRCAFKFTTKLENKCEQTTSDSPLAGIHRHTNHQVGPAN